MTTRSQHLRTVEEGLLNPAAFTTGDATGADVDLSAAESAEFVYLVGLQSGTSYDLVCQEADDDGAGSPDTWAAVADADLVGGTNTIVITTSNDNAIHRRGYRGDKKWVRVFGEDNTSGNLVLGGCVSVGHKRHL